MAVINSADPLSDGFLPGLIFCLPVFQAAAGCIRAWMEPAEQPARAGTVLIFFHKRISFCPVSSAENAAALFKNSISSGASSGSLRRRRSSFPASAALAGSGSGCASFRHSPLNSLHHPVLPHREAPDPAAGLLRMRPSSRGSRTVFLLNSGLQIRGAAVPSFCLLIRRRCCQISTALHSRDFFCPGGGRLRPSGRRAASARGPDPRPPEFSSVID